jgi:hypothetical protein
VQQKVRTRASVPAICRPFASSLTPQPVLSHSHPTALLKHHCLLPKQSPVRMTRLLQAGQHGSSRMGRGVKTFNHVHARLSVSRLQISSSSIRINLYFPVLPKPYALLPKCISCQCSQKRRTPKAPCSKQVNVPDPPRSLVITIVTSRYKRKN